MFTLITLVLLAADRNDAEATLALTCDANEASQLAITTFYARASFEYPGRVIPSGVRAPEPCRRAEYWRRSNAVRVIEDYPDELDEYLIMHDRRYLLSKHRLPDGTTRLGANLRAETDCLANIWRFALFEFEGQPLYSFLRSNSTGTSVREEELDGRRCIRITQQDKNALRNFWIDPSINHLARRITVLFPDGIVDDKRVTSFREFEKGFFFPTQMDWMRGPEADVRLRRGTVRVVKLDVVKINQPLPDSDFQIRYPRGTPISDEIAGTWFTVDENGRPMEAPKPLAATTPNAPGQPAFPIAQTSPDADSTSSVNWKLIWVLAVVAVISGLWASRRRLRRV